MSRKWPILAAVLAPLALGACDDDLGPDDEAQVRVAFTTSASAQNRSPANASLAAQDLVITGSNGTLTITDVRLIVAEFELEGPEACLEVDDDDDDEEGEPEFEECEFEALPTLLDLPLDGGEVVVATDFVPPGTFTKLEFEIEDLDEDDDDEVFTRQAIAGIRAQLESLFPGFPREASMVVTGSFAPAGGGASRDFTVFFDADIDVEVDLEPPLVIDGGEANRTIVVTLDPRMWFSRQGVVLDLSAFDGQTLDLEADIEDGVADVEIEVDD